MGGVLVTHLKLTNYRFGFLCVRTNHFEARLIWFQQDILKRSRLQNTQDGNLVIGF